MLEIKISVRTYQRKSEDKKGKEFAKGSILGKFIPKGVQGCWLNDEYYTVILPKTHSFPLNDDGIYLVAAEEAWIDNRAEYVEKRILRVKNVKTVLKIGD